jgi:hypothetical protein
MRFEEKRPPRGFTVGKKGDITIKDCGRVFLAADEQVTFVTPSGKEHDFAAKSWGFYSTPSTNARLKEQGFKTALVRNTRTGRWFVMAVEKEKRADFEAYIASEDCRVEEWLDER